MSLEEILTPEFIAEANENIDRQMATNDAATDARDRERKLRIYDDFLHYETAARVLHIPQPTLGFLMLYQERRSYFEDDEHGLGRLLVTLRRMKEPGYIQALRAGADFDDEEAMQAQNNAYLEDKPEYYRAIEAAAKWSEEEAEKKTVMLLEERAGLASGFMARLLSLSNLRDIPSSTSSTECTSEPSES